MTTDIDMPALIEQAAKNPDPTVKHSIELDLFSLTWASDEIAPGYPRQAQEIRDIARVLGAYIRGLEKERDDALKKVNEIETDLKKMTYEMTQVRRHLRLLNGWANEMSRLIHFKPQAG